MDANATPRLAAGACAAVGMGAMLLLGAAAYGVIYLALGGDMPSAEMVLHRTPRLLCTLLRACSA
ncbi:MAG: hypothetical protein EOO54_16905 [Haliea sp.]|nr:MAG: hypothetical protein EOO54_16905 [Haliea sp.]